MGESAGMVTGSCNSPLPPFAERRKSVCELWAYGLLFFWSLLIYLTIPLVRTIQQFVQTNFGSSFFGYLVLVLISGGSIGAGIFLRKKHRGRLSCTNFAWIAAVAALYFFFTIRLWERPEEAIHLPQYGVLSGLAYRALRYRIPDATVFLTASLVTLFIGTVDEIIQWMVPGRYWDIRDVGLNFLAGVLFQFAVWKGFSPPEASGPIRVRSIRWVSAALGACMVLLGLCASNTPSRIASYSGKIPFLSYLKTESAMMSDYGYRHAAPGTGTFYSRFTKSGLQTLDRTNCEDYSKILNVEHRMEYDRFLKIYNPAVHPFLYEMRIRLFRRDRYAELAEAPGRSELETRIDSTIAFKENLILEKYFGETLRRTIYRWHERKLEKIESRAEKDADYRSPVSSELFTRFTEAHLWTAISGALLILYAVNRYLGAGVRKYADWTRS